MKLLICGGREFTDVEYAVTRFQKVHTATPVTTLISGMARNGDMIGVAWAKELGIPVEEYAITKDDWNRDGKAAGPIRNEQMLREGKPDMVLGLPGGNGTANMCRIAREAGVKVIEYKYHYFSQARDPVDGYLSNFYRQGQTGPDNLIYPTNEHWYQCEKTLDPEKRNWIYESSDAAVAKKRGNAKGVPLRDDWSTYKIEAMILGLRQKFLDKSALTDRLLFTGDDYLVEYTRWGDTFWGVDTKYQGQNWLGRLLMRRRDEIMSGRLYE